jgi:hypothetical protein
MGQRRRDDLYREVSYVFTDMAPFGVDYTSMTAKIEHKPTGSTFKVKEEYQSIPVHFDLIWHVKDGPSPDHSRHLMAGGGRGSGGAGDADFRAGS